MLRLLYLLHFDFMAVNVIRFFFISSVARPYCYGKTFADSVDVSDVSTAFIVSGLRLCFDELFGSCPRSSDRFRDSRARTYR